MTINEKVLRWQNILVVISAFVLVILSIVLGNFESTRFIGSYEIQTIGKWSLDYAGMQTEEVRLPIGIDMVKGEPFSLTTRLPDQLEQNYAIMLQSDYCKIEIFSDEELLDSYATALPTPFSRMTGNIRIITEIPQECAGNDITIKATPYFTSHMSFNQIYTGDCSSLKLYVVLKNLWRLLLAVVLLTVSIVCLGISGYHFYYKTTKNNWAFYHIGAMLIYLDLWLVCSSDIPQIFTDANGVISFISFISLAIMPIHMAAFYEELIPSERDIYRYLQIVGWIVPALEVLGCATRLWDPVNIFYAGHVILVLTILVAIVEGRKSCNATIVSREINNANFFLILTIAGGLICFYIAPTSGYDAVFAGIGISAYAFYLFAIVLQREARILEDIKTRDLYRELAFKDMQTNLKNRGSFNLEMTRVDIGEYGEVFVDLIIMDLNYLKKTNDKYGHLAGDVLINTAADCIDRTFRDFGDCYRIGGDEFAVMAFEKHEFLGAHIDTFKATLEEINKDNTNMPVSISIGVSSGRYAGGDKFMEQIFIEADQAMYEHKKILHEQLNSIYS